MGASSEGYAKCNLQSQKSQGKPGFLTSNSNISPFLSALIDDLGCVRVPSGGVGNKALLLLEGVGEFYIQDRGVKRWDTAGPQAVLEAFGGILTNLRAFENNNAQLMSYNYAR